jgi:hypothetical protein
MVYNVPDLNPKKKTPIYTYTAMAGAILFFFVNANGNGFFYPEIFGSLANGIIGGIAGFLPAYIALKVKKEITKEITKDRQMNRFGIHVNSALEKFQNSNLSGALEEYMAAQEIEFENAKLHFNMARLYSLLKNKEKTYDHLGFAFKFNFINLEEKIKTNPDFKYIRQQPDFDDFIDKWIKKKKP